MSKADYRDVGAHRNALGWKYIAVGALRCTPMSRLAAFYLCVLCFLAPLSAEPETPKPPLQRQPVGAQAYIVMDVETGRILAQRSAKQQMFPASTTKTLTALTAIEKGDITKVVRVGPNPPKVGEASIYLLEGEEFRLADLVRALMIRSANDSGVAIAEAVAGSVPEFAKKMNEMAKEAGATQSNFVNPHGLHDPNHYTTAYDLALITRRAMKHSFFNEISAVENHWIKGNYKIGERRLLQNRNRLLFMWDKADGVKTGYTRQAGRCLIASATVKNSANGKPWRLLSVVLKSPDIWNDSYNLLQFHGFNQYQPTVVTRAQDVAAQAKIIGGAHPVAAVVKHDVQMPLRSYERAYLELRPQLQEMHAPILEGENVGLLEYWFKDQKLGEVPLVARESTQASLLAREIPAAAGLVPVEPWKRYGLYMLLGAFLVTLLVTILTILKVIYNARRKPARKIAVYRPEPRKTSR